MSTNKYYKPTEAIEKLGISYTSFLRLIKSGELPCIRIGKQIRIPAEYFSNLENQVIGKKELCNE